MLLRQRLWGWGYPPEISDTNDVEGQVRQIIDRVCNEKDAALLYYTSKFDRVKLTAFEVSKPQVTEAYGQVTTELVSSLKLAAERIHSFHSAQRASTLDRLAETGLVQVRPLQRVGLYIPGGGGATAFPSTVLMTAIPARVAGVGEVILVTPPGKDGKVPPSILVAADIAGVDRIFSVGGAQAIAALAFGTESIPKVDKICGPGNIFVTAAKRLLFGVVGIDGLEGPSEVLIIADETASPEYCAADLLAQAEHDPLSSAILVTTSRRLANEINQEVDKQLPSLERKEVATKSLDNTGRILVVSNSNEAIELANLYAPEHLCLMVDKAVDYIDKITNAGCIVAGKNSTVVLGDYVAGPSHVLPTGGTARFGSPLNVLDFIKLTNLVNVDEASFKQLAQAAAVIAREEGFEAHARVVERRLKTG